MATFQDAFGSTVTGDAATGWTRGGTSIGACSEAQAMTVFGGMAPEGWTPPPAPPTTMITPLDFMRRFTTAEMQTLNAANPLWGMQVAAAGSIDVTDPVLLADIAAAVAAGALTQARMTQVLDLTKASP